MKLMTRESFVPDPLIHASWAIALRTSSDANKCGGDIFDAVPQHQRKLHVLIADSSAKGLLGSFHAALLRRAFARQARRWKSPAAILRALNDVRVDSRPTGLGITFAAAFVATIDAESGTLCYASAGHDFALISAGRDHRHLPQTGPMLGVAAEPKFDEHREQFLGGNLLVVATDGISACRSRLAPHKQFGSRGIVDALGRMSALDARSALARVTSEADAFCGGQYSDDATIAVVSADRFDSVRGET